MQNYSHIDIEEESTIMNCIRPTIEFFTIGKCVRSDRNKKQFLRKITIKNLNVRII